MSPGSRGLLSLSFVALAATSTRAQPVANAEAEALFDQGRKLMDEKKIAEACTAFAASQRVSPLISTQMNLADCRERNKELATAYGLWRDVDRQTRAPVDDMMERINKTAFNRVKAIEPRLSKLTVEMDPPDRVPNLEITRNGAAFDLLLLGQQLPIDGGSYTVVARAPGYHAVSVTIDIAPERDIKSVRLPPLQPLPPDPTAAPASGTPTTTTAVRSAEPPSMTLPIVLGGAGVVLLGGALGFDLWARSQYDDAKVEPDDFRQEDLWSGAKTKRYVAQGLAVAGVAAVGVGVWLFVRARSYERPAVVPTVDHDGAGLTVIGAF